MKPAFLALSVDPDRRRIGGCRPGRCPSRKDIFSQSCPLQKDTLGITSGRGSVSRSGRDAEPRPPTGRANLGHALETVVLNELERRKAEVSYVRTEGGLDVHFLARYPGAGEELIQVCADVVTPETVVRELRALAEAARDHPRAVPRFLVLDRDAVARVTAAGAEAQPAHEWLLAPDASP